MQYYPSEGGDLLVSLWKSSLFLASSIVLASFIAIHYFPHQVQPLLTQGSLLLKSLEKSTVEQSKRFFEIREASISGTYYLSESDVQKALGTSLPLWVWEVDSQKLKESLTQSPYIKDASIEISFIPPSLQVEIQESEPWFVAELGDESWLVERDGSLMSPLKKIQVAQYIVQASKLPRLKGNLAENRRFRYLVQILELFQVAGGLPFEMDQAELLPQGGVALSVALGDPAPVKRVLLQVESFEEAEASLERLRQVLDDLHSRQERASQIDLRFKGRAVVDRS